jgi:nucleoside-diphosphate-sugar epimerase
MTARALGDRRVFVTGGSGFLGAHLLRMLASSGAQVHALRHHARAVDIAAVTWHGGDLLDRDGLASLLASIRPHYVFHLAAYGAKPAERGREQIVATNINGAANLWVALPDSVQRVVMAGSCREYADAQGPVDEAYPCDPRTPYLVAKHAAVQLLSAFAREDSRSLVVIRPFGPYGPGDESDRVIPSTIRALVAGETVDLTSGEQLCDFAFVDDQVRAITAAATAVVPVPVALYNVGGGQVMTLRAVMEQAADSVGEGACSRLRFGARPSREGDSRAVCADITAARRDLGYRPTVALPDGLARTVDWIRALARV